MKTYAKKSQNGRSMIEMLGVLAIVGVLSAGGIAGYSMAMQSYKTTQLIEKIQLIAQQTRRLYKTGYPAANLTQSLIDSGKITDMKSPFGGDMYVTSGYSTTFDVFTPANIPAETCMDILTVWENDDLVWGFHLDDMAYKFRRDDGTYPVTFAKALSACKGGNKKFQIIFR